MSTAIIGLIIIGVCIIPFIILKIKNNNSRNTSISNLSSIAASYNARIDKADIGSDFVIGTDTNQKKIFFEKSINGDKQALIVDLLNITHAEVSKQTKIMPTGKENRVIVTDIGINLFPMKKGEDIIYINFYNLDRNNFVRNELELATTWNERINAMIK